MHSVKNGLSRIVGEADAKQGFTPYYNTALVDERKIKFHNIVPNEKVSVFG
jgi:hypothetical protein